MSMKNRIRIVYKNVEIPAALIFLCAVSTAMMYMLCKSQMFICTLIMTALTSGMYLMFYKLRKRRIVSLLAFLAIFFTILSVNYFVSAIYGPIELARFIFATSNYFDPMLAGASMLMFSLIFAFPTFYFTALLPRPGFLVYIAAIPIMLGARTAGGLPIGILAFLVSAYLLAAAGVARPEVAENVTYFNDKRARIERIAAMTAAAAVALVALLVVPINDKTPMGQYMDTFLLYRGNVSFGTQTISEFEDRTLTNRGNNTPSTEAIFVAAADYPYKVTRETYDYYEGEDGWTNPDGNAERYIKWDNFKSLNVSVLIRNLKTAAQNGKLEKYRDALSNVQLHGNTMENNITFRFVDNSSGHVLLHPAKTFGVTIRNYNGKVYHSEKDEVWSESDYGRNPVYTARFYSDIPNEDFIEMLEEVDFGTLLNDAYMEDVISNATYQAFALELSIAQTKYSETKDNGITPQIQALADQITEGLTNDYEKALAIEKWFASGYTYDLNYVPKESTAEYFLFTGKRGICTDFATATTLLLRAAGIPARYTEGYQLKEDSTDIYGQYIVKAEQAHAYTTAYIKGYGWLEIDGTRYAAISGENAELKTAMTFVLIAAAILGILAIVFRRQLSEAAFRVSYHFRSRNGKIRAVYIRVRKLSSQISGTPEKSAAAEEVRNTLTRSLDMGEQAAEIADAANELLYGGGNPNVDTKRLMDDYKAIYKTKRSRKK